VFGIGGTCCCCVREPPCAFTEVIIAAIGFEYFGSSVRRA
jgi:hypothetical protein